METNEMSPYAALQQEMSELREQYGKLEKENKNLAKTVLSSQTDMQGSIDKVT